MGILYVTVSIIVVMVTAAIMVLTLPKYKEMDFRTVIAVCVSSVFFSILLPMLYVWIKEWAVVLTAIAIFVTAFLILQFIGKGAVEMADNHIFEKHVDTEQIIDKMRLENNSETSCLLTDNIVEKQDDGCQTSTPEDMTMEEHIDRAFEMKQKGEYEEAILYYMFALDKKLSNRLGFLIILDICTLYKELGQVDMARDILSNYLDKYGYEMDSYIRAELEANL